MLSDKSRPYIDASVPVLREHGLAITTRFYQTMFKENPGLTNLFNMGNQANGSQQQSLASAVFTYAANHDNRDALAPVLSRIAHKHASVGLTPAHYPIVARHLLGAIAHVLGEAATPELMAAWDEAYWLLAGELIAAESRLYDRADTGPAHRCPMRVANRLEQAEDIVTLTLQPAAGGPPPGFLPGQYISVVVELAPGVFQQRQYSLADAPNDTHWRISIRRERARPQAPGGAVSNWIHDNVKVGDTLMVSRPFGDFAPALDGAAPIALLAAGIGVTPMVSVLNTLARRGTDRKVLFAYAARKRSHLAHLDDLAAASRRLPGLAAHIYLESGEPLELSGSQVHAGRMHSGDLLARHRDLEDAEFHLCGPLPFMQAQKSLLLSQGVPAGRIHREVFGPDLLDGLS